MISLHIVVDNAPPEVLDRALLYLKRTKQRYVNIGGGSQLDLARQYVDRVRAEVPGIRIIWRDLEPEDTGIHTKMTPAELFALKVAPALGWFKKHELIFMPDNESSGDDEQIKRYVTWNLEVMKLLHQSGLSGAYGRFATGNIVESQYPLLKPLFDAFKPGDIFSPNEYSNAPGKSSGGHLERYKLAWKAAGWDLPTVIGEAGIAVDYDPGKGYQSIDLSSPAYAQQAIDEEIWYKNGAITRCFYIVGGYSHETFRINNGFYEYLENYYEKHPVDIISPPAPVTTWKPCIVKIRLGAVQTGLHTTPASSNKTIMHIRDFDEIDLDDSYVNVTWAHIRLKLEGQGMLEGYVRWDYFEPVFPEPPTPPPAGPKLDFDTAIDLLTKAQPKLEAQIAWFIKQAEAEKQVAQVAMRSAQAYYDRADALKAVLSAHQDAKAALMSV